jgi:hypothetical protein
MPDTDSDIPVNQDQKNFSLYDFIRDTLSYSLNWKKNFYK